MATKKRTALDNLLPPPTAAPVAQSDAKKPARSAIAAEKPPKKSGEPVKAVANEESEAEVRIGKHEIVKQMLYLPLPVAEQLRSLHFEEQRGQAKRVKLHDYFLEAIDLLFKDRGVKSIKDLTRGK